MIEPLLALTPFCASVAPTMPPPPSPPPYSRVWGWLPRALPPFVSLVVSTVPDDHHGILAQLRRGLAAPEAAEAFLEVRHTLTAEWWLTDD